jgi:hypothetical protein
VVELNRVVAAWLFVNLLFVGVYDLVIALAVGSEQTVSRIIWEWSQRYPPLTIIAGIVLGHLFWPQVVVQLVQGK